MGKLKIDLLGTSFTIQANEDTEYLEKFYPTSTLITGFDIIFFWVARMMMMSMYMMKKVPFKILRIRCGK